MTHTLSTNETQSSNIGCIHVFVLIAASLWVSAVLFGSSIVDLIVTSIAYMRPNYYWVIFPVIKWILLSPVLLPLGYFWPQRRLRAVFHAWLWMSLLILFYIPVRFTSATASVAQSLLHISLGLIFIGLILISQRWKNCKRVQSGMSIPAWNSTGTRNNGSTRFLQILIAVITATLFSYPWLAWGAFGSVLETLLQFLVALILAIIAALILETFLIHHLLETSSNFTANYFLGGFASCMLIMIMGSATGYSFGGMQLLLMICLPLLGWTAAGFRLISVRFNPAQAYHGTRSKYILPVTLLIGLACASPLTLIDPDELIFLLTALPGEIFQWGLYAAFISAGIALIAGILLLIIYFKPVSRGNPFRIRPAMAGLLLLFSIIGAFAIYRFIGQPGFYGEGLFVILKDQVDFRATALPSDPIERRRSVHQTLVSHANHSQASIRHTLEQLGIEYTPYYLVNGLHVQGGPIIRFWLASRPEVERVLENPWLRPLPQGLPPSIGSQAAPTSIPWNLELINVDQVWEDFGITGEGIVIGQSDSGVQSDHPELAPSYRGNNGEHDYNWYDPWYQTTSPNDNIGHGTHSLGIVSGQKVGVAPGTDWIACVNLGRNLGNPALYLDCLQFVFAPFPQSGDPLADGDPDLGAHVLNNSWGCPNIEGCDASALEDATYVLDTAGVFVVTSAGNEGPECSSLSSPIAIYPNVITVGAIDRFENLTNFSSLGPVISDGSGRTKPDLVAPGLDVLSSMPGDTYSIQSGTSFAGPHVAGVVALMWSANPELIGDTQTTREILLQSARDYSGALPNCPGARLTPSTAVGYGIVDAYAAVQRAISFRK